MNKEIFVLTASLYQQHLHIGIAGQAIGQHASRATGTNNNVVR